MQQHAMLYPEKKYDVILIDPPWLYEGQNKPKGNDYLSMPDIDIALMPIRDLLKTNGMLFLWATCPKLDLAILTLRRWGLHYRGVAFNWIKVHRKTGLPMHGGHGIKATTTKPHSELVLCASRKKPNSGRPMPLANECVGQLVFAPRREASRKPDEVKDRIEELYPFASRLEMFAREETYGWDSWGYEVGKFV
jgi:N6-adenosine-specific RNA methylase IME4